MNISKNLISVFLVIALVAGIGIPFLLLNNTNQPQQGETITLNLLVNAGVMIETEGNRLYIDPISLPSNYSDLPADVILVTHPHGDHYEAQTINDLQKEDTVNIFPENMTDAIDAHNGTAVNPCDQLQVGPFNITAFYMYTWAPEGYEASHPRECNWTSYIIDIDGFTIFHAGDSKCLDEYEMIAGEVDVALLPLGPGCQTMYEGEVVDALEIIRPTYFIPIHYTTLVKNSFIRIYDISIEGLDCQIVDLDYFEIHVFDVES